MKLYHVIIGCLITITLSFTSTAMDRRSNNSNGFSIDKVLTKLRPTPIYTIQNYSNSTSSATKRWMEVSITYKPPTRKLKKNNLKYTWLDDVTMEVEVLFKAMFNNKQVMAHARGKVDYWSIRMDGKTHYAMMLLHPQILARYGLNSRYKDDDFMAVVSFYRGGTLIFKAFSTHRKYSRTQIMKIFKKYSGRLKAANYLELGDVLLSRKKSPWAFVEYSKYDMIKPENNTRR